MSKRSSSRAAIRCTGPISALPPPPITPSRIRRPSGEELETAMMLLSANRDRSVKAMQRLLLRRARSRGDASARDDRYDCQRSEEHTSELQSPDHLVCRLLLEKKKNK